MTFGPFYIYGFPVDPKGKYPRNSFINAVYATENPSLLSDKNSFTGFVCQLTSTCALPFSSFNSQEY